MNDKTKYNNTNEAVIISGANGNIGSTLAKSILKDNNINVVLIYHNNRYRLDPLLKNHCQHIELIHCDIKYLSSLQEKIQKSLNDRKWIPSSLVHTAAMRSIDHNSLLKSDPKIWKEVIDNNIIGTYNILKTYLTCCNDNIQRIKNRESFFRIVLLGSCVSRSGLPYGSAYSASKAAISNISRSLSVELSENNILINTISPGPVNIDDSQFTPEYREFRKKYYDQTLRDIPLKRFAEPEDVISLILYLISNQNKYITGEEFFITGGKL